MSQPTPDFQNPSCWLSSIFNTLPFSLFITKYLSSLSLPHSTNKTFHELKVLAFACDDTSTPLSSANVIVDPTHSIPEPNISFSDGVFNVWLGIYFQNTLSFTYIRSSRPSKCLTSYELTVLIPFYLTILSSLKLDFSPSRSSLMYYVTHQSRITFLYNYSSHSFI